MPTHEIIFTMNEREYPISQGTLQECVDIAEAIAAGDLSRLPTSDYNEIIVREL